MATTLNGKEMMPRALQVQVSPDSQEKLSSLNQQPWRLTTMFQILKDIKSSCADLGGALGFSWIADSSFEGGPIEDDNQPAKNANETDVDTSKSRKFTFQNHGRYSGFAADRYTNMVFSDWALEVSAIFLTNSTTQRMSTDTNVYSNLTMSLASLSLPKSSLVWSSARPIQPRRTSECSYGDSKQRKLFKYTNINCFPAAADQPRSPAVSP
jgi:hypothetical protein